MEKYFCKAEKNVRLTAVHMYLLANARALPPPTSHHNSYGPRGWSGSAMVLGKLPVPGRPAYLD